MIDINIKMNDIFDNTLMLWYNVLKFTFKGAFHVFRGKIFCR